MSIRYQILLPCPPRESVGEDTLEDLVMRRARAEALARQFRSQRRITDETAMTFRERRALPDGSTEERDVSVAELRGETEALDALAPDCEDCPASIDGWAFGCFSSISFPVSAFAEEWLGARPGPVGSRSRELLKDAVERHGWGKGGRMGEWRRLGLLERDAEAVIASGEGALGTDAILHEMFLVGEVSAEHALGVLLHLNALRTTDGREGDDVIALIDEVLDRQSAEEAPGLEFALDPVAGEERCVHELKRYLYALFLGFSLQATVRIVV